MTTLITGASGFVGSRLARILCDEGQDVRLLTRKSSDTANLDALPAERVIGDLRDLSSLKKAMRGIDALYHVAADYRLWTPNPRELYDSNVTGTENILNAAADAGVTRIVYTSSVATLGINADGTPSDETTPVSLADMIGHYKRSKYLAEQRVLEMIQDRQLPVVIVNPSTPVGPGDVKPTPTGRMIREAAHGRMPAYVDTGLNIVHVDDVARGHMLAFEKGEIGQRYILGGEDLSLREILAQIAQLTGRKPPKVQLPRAVVYPIAVVSQLFARAFNTGEPQATVDGLKMSRKRMYFSSEKAKTELGYTARPASEALGDAVNWFIESEKREAR